MHASRKIFLGAFMMLFLVSCKGKNVQIIDETSNQFVTYENDDSNSIEEGKIKVKQGFDSKYHVVENGQVYFRRYSTESISKGDVLGKYYEVKTVPKSLVSLDEEGNLVEMFVDNGYGSIFLVDGRLFSQCIVEDGSSRVYSCTLSGDKRVQWESCEILDQAEAGFLVCKTNNDGLIIIDNKEEKRIVEESVEYQGCFNNVIYYSSQRGKEVQLYSVDLQGVQNKIISVSVSEAEEKGQYDSNEIEIRNLDVCGEYVSFVAGNYGSEGAYYGGLIVLCKYDGTEKKFFCSDSTKKSFVRDGDNQALLFEDNEKVVCEVLKGEIRQEFERVPRYSILDVYHSVSGYDMETKKKEDYLTEKEYEELLKEIEGDQEYQCDFNEIKYAEIIDNKLFFNIVLEKADTSKDIGWRAYYERVVTYEYMKYLNAGTIIQLYSY